MSDDIGIEELYNEEKVCRESDIHNVRYMWPLVFSNLIMLGATLTVVPLWRTSPLLAPETESLQQSLCLDCKDIHINGNDDITEAQSIRRHRKDNGGWLCCAEAHRHLDRLINESVKTRYRMERNMQVYGMQYQCARHGENGQKPAARVVGISETVDGDGDDDNVTLQWDQSSGQSFLHSTITYDNGRFTVRTPGYYYVYTQIALKNSGTLAENSTDANTLYHAVYKRNYKVTRGEDEKLLENFQSNCKMRKADGKSASYVGAAFNLRENDTLYVKCSDPSMVKPSQFDNYFGLHRI